MCKRRKVEFFSCLQFRLVKELELVFEQGGEYGVPREEGLNNELAVRRKVFEALQKLERPFPCAKVSSMEQRIRHHGADEFEARKGERLIYDLRGDENICFIQKIFV